MSRILIVDDDNDFSQACGAILQQEGYDVVSANAVEDVPPLIEKGGINLILLDIMMESPDDGIALAHKLKKDGVAIPVIMLSGVSKVTGYKYNCDEMLPCLDFIEKPVTPDMLLRKVKAVLDQSV